MTNINLKWYLIDNIKKSYLKEKKIKLYINYIAEKKTNLAEEVKKPYLRSRRSVFKIETISKALYNCSFHCCLKKN